MSQLENIEEIAESHNKKRVEKNKISIKFSQYLTYSICGCKSKNSQTQNVLKFYSFYKQYFEKVLNITTYFNFYNSFKQYTKIFLDKSDRRLIKNLYPKLRYKENKNNSFSQSGIGLNVETKLIKNFK